MPELKRFDFEERIRQLASEG
ncbi:MAG: hypothetical protein MGAcid_01450 [uncultured Acidilobus sp. MG]|nr:MAG: hypothetical protein MGAcid_01450 [uncultured Acidilobus sp. MG]